MSMRFPFSAAGKRPPNRRNVPGLPVGLGYPDGCFPAIAVQVVGRELD
jgi:hypothetical protein